MSYRDRRPLAGSKRIFEDDILDELLAEKAFAEKTAKELKKLIKGSR